MLLVCVEEEEEEVSVMLMELQGMRRCRDKVGSAEDRELGLAVKKEEKGMRSRRRKRRTRRDRES